MNKTIIKISLISILLCGITPAAMGKKQKSHSISVTNQTGKTLWVERRGPIDKRDKIPYVAGLKHKIEPGKSKKIIVERYNKILFRLAWSNVKPKITRKYKTFEKVYFSSGNDDSWTKSFTIKPDGNYSKQRIYMKKGFAGIKFKAKKDVKGKAEGPFNIVHDLWDI